MSAPFAGRVLVTGSTGFIGKRLSARLKSLGCEVSGFARNLGHDAAEAASYEPFKDKSIEAVIHLAGLTFVPLSWKDPGAFYRVNSLGTARALEFCREISARMVYVSAYVYGTPEYLPMDEKHPVKPNNPYAHSKWLGEELCRFYADNMGVASTVLRPFNIYGPGQDGNFLIPTLVRQAREGGEIVVKDDSPRRDYIHLDDVVEACVAALSPNDFLRVFNVGSGTSLSVRDVVEAVIEARGGRINWRSLGEKRPNEIPDTVADCAAIREALGWAPKREFKEAIRELLQNP